MRNVPLGPGKLLQVANPDQFIKTIAGGIGSGKAFGFGLLSLARLVEDPR